MWLGFLLFLAFVAIFGWALMAAASRMDDEVEQERHRLSEAALRALARFDDDDPPLRRDEWRRDMPPRPRRRASERDEYLSGVSGFDYPPDEKDR